MKFAEIGNILSCQSKYLKHLRYVYSVKIVPKYLCCVLKFINFIMACTPQQIEAKRKIALEKLKAKKLKLSSPTEIRIDSTPKNLQHQQRNLFKAFQKNYNNNSTTNQSYNSPKQTINTNKFFGQNVKGVTTLLNDKRFELNITYHSKVIEICKTIPSKNYCTKTKNWSFNLDDYELLMSKLQNLQPEIVVERLPKYVLNLLKNTNFNNNDINIDKIEPELLNILMPFQKEGVCFGIKHNGRCLIADDMGLGKTIQALAIASYYRTDWPLLIVTTASMKNTWEETIHKYLPSVPLASIRYMTSGKDYINDTDILIVSHDMMTRCTDKLLERGFKFLIIDESHIIKNFKAKCTKSAINLAKRMRRTVLLSGTPALSRPSELYSQLSIIDEKFFGNFYEFSKRYCDGKEGPFGWDSSGKSNLTELEIILSKKFMIRRIKSEVLQSLPDKSREIIKLDVHLNRLSKTEQLCLTQLIDNYIEKKSTDKHAALLTLFAESAKIKIPSVCLYIEDLLKTGEKFIVFAHHQVMLDAICIILNKKQKVFIRIDGNTTSDQRKYFIDKFQLKDECIAAVLSITAANSGITLTAAQLVLFAELHWNPSTLAQAESRAHRIGQSGAVNVRYLFAEGTVDDHIWPLLQLKQNVLNEVGLSTDSFQDTDVKDQIITSTNRDGIRRTSVGTLDISNFMIKTPPTEQLDETLQEFLNDDNDDIFVNADIDCLF